MMVIRTFVAVLIAEDLKANIAKVQEQVKKLAPDVKWVTPENFHVTIKFLGNVREDALSQVFSAVNEAAEKLAPFEMSFSGLGVFPNAAKARVVWVGIDQGCDELRRLADVVDKNLARLGYPKEDRAFKAHVTIGRVKEGKRLPGDVARSFEEIDAGDLGSQRVESIAVMQSELLREGPVYSPMSESKLQGNRD